jgi:serine/threonine protein kinase
VNVTEFREFQDGEVIAGTRYRVLCLIGVGGMGSVYEVEHIELGKRFVLKALLRELSRRDDLVQRLRNEWRALARLQHASIVNVTDAGTSGGGVPFYVMERLDGQTLATYLRQKRRLHVLDAVNIAASVLEALSAAHEIGIIHRDVKPANVFVVSGGGVKLLDFGIAKIADATGVVTARGLAVGTPRYMSPEQARGERVDGRSDVYASALILYEMIAGVGPFDDAHDANQLLLAHLAREAPPLSSLLSGVSPELDRIVTSMLAKDCRQRPANAREAAEQLRNFALRQRSIPATDVPTARAGYGAETVLAAAPRERSPRPINESITRVEGAAARAQLGRNANRSDEALTQRIALPSGTTQITPVTLATNTGDAFSVSSVPNTTFVSSPPSFDGTTTLQMSVPSPSDPSRARGSGQTPSPPPIERPERTEMLDDVPLAAVPEPPDTRTQVPVPERARPLSITPPPMVDNVPAESRSPRANRAGRWAGLAAGGLAVLIATGVLLRRAALPDAQTPAAAVAAQPLAATPPLGPPHRPENGTPPQSESALIDHPAPAASSSAQVAAGGAAPAASSSARNSGMIFSAKSLRSSSFTAASAAHRVPPALPSARNLTRRPSAPELPASGL